MRHLLPLVATFVVAVCACTAEEQPQTNAAAQPSSAVAYDVPEGEVRLVPRATPRPSTTTSELAAAGPVHAAVAEPGSPEVRPSMPGARALVAPACNVAPATHHACPSGFERRFICASASDLPARCQAVPGSPATTVSVCCPN